MRFHTSRALLGAAFFICAVSVIYLVLDTLSLRDEYSRSQKADINQLEARLSGIESDLFVNQETINKIKETVVLLRQAQVDAAAKSTLSPKSGLNKTLAVVARGDLSFAADLPNRCDIRMSDVYESLEFDNTDGGAWKQGWEITYDAELALNPDRKLKVFVAPHSHNDPGWLKTFETYYQSQTRHILNLMVNKLKVDKRRKFIWAEISYLALWWSQQDDETRVLFRQLVKSGQIEIVTGGWVMNDEANSHFYAIIEQLSLGHEWCRNVLGTKPTNGWAIDPFGMTPTMSYLLKRMGFDAMLIQRTHYAVKKHLAKNQDLEFRWRQHWDHEDTTDMLTHMMPFYSYDIPHTCGPDPKVCCQFDFLRLPGGRSSCPWRVPPQLITESNVAERARTLMDQYRKKAELYKTNVLLVPLGDDFRYDKSDEWDKQYENYQKIFDYVNANSEEFNIEISFGTLQDYFDSIRSESKTKSDVGGLFKSLSGDFFTYSDRDDHYWSGYYTSRPFYKNLDRVVLGYLRAAEIMFSMMWAQMEYVGSDYPDLAAPLMEAVVIARQNLALFQHHDGVTGTAKDHVVVDYGKKLLESVHGCQRVMSHAAHYLLHKSKALYKPDVGEIWFDLDDTRHSHYSLPRKTIIDIRHPDSPSKVVVFNSHARHRSEMVSVVITDPDVRVYKLNSVDGEDEEEVIPSQLSPIFTNEGGQISNNEFLLTFLAQVKGFSLKTFFIASLRAEEVPNSEMNVAQIRIHNSMQQPYQVRPFEDIKVFEAGVEFTLENGYVRANFNPDGILNSITTLEDNVKTDTKVEFFQYGTKTGNRDDKSGAYIFLPDGNAKILTPVKPLVRIVEGKLVSYVEVFTPWLRHVVTLYTSPGSDGTGVKINNDIDIRLMHNTEIGMRISSDLESGDYFYTDLNGFQMIKRKRYLDKLPLQANYYPVASLQYIQDDKSRLSLVTKQPLGGSSLRPGQMDIMLDRRLMQDDNRGLQQGVTDNHVTPHTFYLLLERKTPACQHDEPTKSADISYPSLLALNIRHAILNPLYTLIYTSTKMSNLAKEFEPLEKDISCDIDVVNLRTEAKMHNQKMLPIDQSVLILHRQGFNSCYKPFGLTCSTNGGKINLEEMMPELYSDQMRHATISQLHSGVEVQKRFTVSLKPMEIYAFVMRR